MNFKCVIFLIPTIEYPVRRTILKTSFWVERNRQKNTDRKVTQKESISRKKKLATLGTLN